MTRLSLLLLVAGLFTACATPPAEPPTFETLGVVEVVPEGRLGTWRVGGTTIVATAETRFVEDHPALIGRFAEVVYRRDGDAAIAVEIVPQSFAVTDIHDGPYVFWRGPDEVEVVGVAGGERTSQTYRDVRASLEVRAGKEQLPSVTIAPDPPTVPPARYEMPSRLLAISDLEGNHGAMLAYLNGVGVVDADGHWQWGDGHLLFNGDIIDRGDKVTEILWTIRRLQREARAAGGRVHFVLGNHESMVMVGDLRYIHNKYRVACRQLGLSYDELYGPTTEIGRWWRTRNSVVKIGRLLFVHGGYSPALDALQLTPEEINDAIRARLDDPRPKHLTVGASLNENLAWARGGPLWYRGYFHRSTKAYGPVPSSEAMDAILRRHDVDHIIVGHSVVPDVGWLDPERRLIGIDVKWAEPGEAEGLLIEGGTLMRLGADGVRRPLTIQQSPPRG